MSSSTTTTQTTTVNGQHLYRLTNGILDAHSFHFITISLLFLPFTFAASAAVQFYSSSSSSATDPFNLLLIKTIIASSHNLLTSKTIITVLAVILPTVAGVALITYTANQALIHRRPLTFSSALKSLSNSYIHLLHTVTAGSVTLVIVFLAFTLFPIAVIEAIKALGFDFDLMIFSVLVNSIASAYAISFFIVIWGSVAAITVFESKSGFEALRQSANQSTEFRRQSFNILFLTGFAIIPALLWLAVSQNSGSTAKPILILQVAAVYLQTPVMMLHYVVANTVLYAQYKAAIGERTAVKGEVSGEFVRVVADEAKKEVNGEGLSYIFNLLLIVWMILFANIIFTFFKFF